MGVAFRLLGPFEVSVGDVVLDIAGSRQQALLLDLLLAGGTPRSVDRLVEDLVPNGCATGREVIHTRLARLRRSLGPAAGMIVRAGPGYALRLDDTAVVDADRFTALVADARRYAAAGERQQAARLYRTAEDLWRGAACEGFLDYPFAAAEATRLEEIRVSAVEERVELDLRAGRHGEVVAELRELASRHPLRERLWGQLAVALYQAGRQTEALRTLHELRAALSELGVVPTPELLRLEQAILGHDPSLVRPPDRERASLAARGEPGDASARAVPLALAPGPHDLPFVGRKHEREAVAQAWKGAASGESHIVLLTGDVGAGKTRLLAEAVRDIGTDGAVLYGRCDEELGLPYQPFAEAIRHYVTAGPSHGFLRSLGSHADALARLVPELHDALDDDDSRPREDPGDVELFEAVAAMFRVVASERPLLVVLEDLHWAGRGTLLLLRYLARSHRVPRMLLVLTWADSGVPPNETLHDLVSDLRSEPGTTALRVPPLTEEETLALVGLAARRPAADLELSLARRLHDLTEGNAFFVLQVLAQRGEESFVADGAGARRLALDLPREAREAVSRRVKRLSPQTRTLLGIAAVIGAEFDLVLLRRASGLDLAPVLDALDEAVRAGIVVEHRGRPGCYRYAQRLVRQVLYESFTDTRRAQIHVTIGEHLEHQRATGVPVHPAVLAHHFARGASLDSARRAAVYALEAGRVAEDQGAFERAAGQYRRGLRAAAATPGPEDDLRLELLLALAKASRQLLDVEEMRSAARRVATAARVTDRADLLARAAVAFGATTTHGSANVEAIDLCEEALDRLPSDAHALRSQLEATLSWQCQAAGEPERARELSDRALGAARAAGDTAALALALVARGWSLVGTHRVREVAAFADELLELARRSSDSQLYAYALRLRGPARLALGDRAGFDEDADQLARLAEVSANPAVGATVSQWAAMAAMADGRLDDAEREIAQVLERGRGVRDFEHVVATQHVWLALLRHEPQAVRTLLDELVVAADSIPGFRAAYALVLVEAGDTAAARSQLDASLAGGVQALKQDVTYGATLAALADVAAAVGSGQQCQELLCALRPFRGLHVVGATGTHWAGPFDARVDRLTTRLEVSGGRQDVAVLRTSPGADQWTWNVQV